MTTLERDILEAMGRGMAPWPAAEFNRLALGLFAWQYARNPVARRYWDHLGARPGAVADWLEVPPLPVAAFKHAVVACGDPADAVAWFETSGTTLGAEARGRHYFFTLDLYQAAIRAGVRHFLLPDGAHLPALVLAPSPRQAPRSSLSYYFHRIAAGHPASTSFWGPDGLRHQALAATLDQVQGAGQPVLLLGTAFAFVHFCDAARRRWRLPPGCRALETGGFKGKSRELAPADLYALMERVLGVPAGRIVNQYGMTELTSNFYDPVLLPGAAPDLPRPKQGLPWARAVIRDPETLAPLPPGQVGLIELVDLANAGSAAFLLTQDLGVAVPGGFTVLGRAPGALPRGCSIAVDIALGT